MPRGPRNTDGHHHHPLPYPNPHRLLCASRLCPHRRLLFARLSASRFLVALQSSNRRHLQFRCLPLSLFLYQSLSRLSFPLSLHHRR